MLSPLENWTLTVFRCLASLVLDSDHMVMMHDDAAQNGMMGSGGLYVAELAESPSTCWMSVMLSPFNKIRPGNEDMIQRLISG